MVDSKQTETDADKLFKAATQFIEKGGKDGQKLSNNDKLMFYSLYKQATVGKVNIPAPGRMQVNSDKKNNATYRYEKLY